jgi:FlaG/FlaF family flagellin (archaellin)
MDFWVLIACLAVPSASLQQLNGTNGDGLQRLQEQSGAQLHVSPSNTHVDMHEMRLVGYMPQISRLHDLIKMSLLHHPTEFY